MTPIADITPTTAVASLSASAGQPLRTAPGIGLTFAVVASLGLWAGLAQGALALLA